jgi:sortase A
MATIISSPPGFEHDSLRYVPGRHSRNGSRVREKETAAPFRRLRVALALAGFVLLVWWSWNTGREWLDQRVQNAAFDEELSRAATHAPPSATMERIPPPARGSVLGRVSVPRLGLSAMVREGVDSHTLAIAVGHVPQTALAGRAGNFVLAAHRDTLFRPLKDIREGDVITFESAGSGTLRYQVFATEIVQPNEVRVLRPDAGLAPSAHSQGGGALLTMITCYPFYYVGAAPQRFIVHARLIAPVPQRQAESTPGSAKSRVG